MNQQLSLFNSSVIEEINNSSTWINGGDIGKYHGVETTDLAYLAGIIDGEGCIYISKHLDKRRITPTYLMGLRIVQAGDHGIKFLEDLKNKYKVGKLQIQVKDNPKWSDLCSWMIGSNDALKLLKAVYPFLIIKSDQAYFAIEFQLSMPGYGRKILDETEIIRREWYFNKLKSMK